MKIGFDWLVQQDRYAEYLRRLDGRALLEYYGAQNCIEQFGVDGTRELIHSCLLDRVEPHHSNGDAHPSASFNLDKLTYCCYLLGFGCDAFRLVQKLEDKEGLIDVLPVISQFLTGATREAVALRDELDKVFSTAGPHELPVYSERLLEAWNHPHPYWEQRGISKEAQEVLELGYDQRSHRIVFPTRWYDKLLGWQKRSIPGETMPEYPKYKSSSGHPSSELLYGADPVMKIKGPVVVVESPMSVARAVSLGMTNVVATWGAKVGKGQLDLLRNFDQVIVWFDADPAGRGGSQKVMGEICRRTHGFYVAPEKNKDLADYQTRAEVEDMLATAEPAALVLGRWDAERSLRSYR